MYLYISIFSCENNESARWGKLNSRKSLLILILENCILCCLNDNSEPLRKVLIIPLCNKANNNTTNIYSLYKNYNNC